jgi:hypothetical protein
MTFGSRLRLVPKQRPTLPPVYAASTVLLVCVAAETLGRRFARSDAHDLLGILGLAVFATVLLRTKGSALSGAAWAARAGRAITTFLQSLQFDVGVDMRRNPRIPRATPRSLGVTCVLTTLVLPLLVLGASVLGAHPRSLATTFYVGHVVGLACLWLLLAAAAVLLFIVSIACIHDWHALRFKGRGRRSQRLEVISLLVYFGVILMASVLLPDWTPYAVVGVSLLALFVNVWWPGTPELVVLWRRKTGRRTVRAIDWRDLETLWVAAAAFAFVDLLLLAHGAASLGLAAKNEALPLTNMLRAVLAWIGAPALAAFAWLSASSVITQRRQNPAHPRPTTIHATGPGLDREFLANLAAARKWHLRIIPYEARPFDVRISMVPSPMPPLGRPARWPLAVSARALELQELQDLLERRDVVQRRRALFRAFGVLFKRAARRRFRAGSGFWIAPHLWYISGMSRDTDSHDVEFGESTVIHQIVGPPYNRLFPLPARRHLYEVLEALDVDLIFVEDGIGYRGFRRVLRRIFDHYDRQRSRLEDRHLSGLPGLRCIVHDYDFDNPLRQTGYPETDYEELGRARILHVFRDRGMADDLLDVPIDFDRLLVGV